MKKKELACDYFLKGYSCAEAIAAAFSEELNVTEEAALSLSSMFGGGIAGTRGKCGVVSSALMVLGAQAKLCAPQDKAEAYRLGREFIYRFETQFTSSECKTLLDLVDAKYSENPEARTPSYYKERPCALLVEAAADILEEMLPSVRK